MRLLQPLLLAVIVGAGGLSIARAQTTTPTPEELAEELRALRAEVAELRAERSEHWLNERRAEEVKALVREVLSDADTRASLAESALTAGHNGKSFFLASDEGKFLLTVGGQFQFRYTYNHRRDPSGTGGTNANQQGDTVGFSLPRTKLEFAGYIGAPKITYYVLVNADRDSGAVLLQEAYVGGDIVEGVRLFGGRYKDWFLREGFSSSKKLLAVERSIMSQIFGPGGDNYVEGAGVEVKPWPDVLRASISLNDGFGSGAQGVKSSNVGGGSVAGGNSGFLGNPGNDFQNANADFGVTARVDVKLAGAWRSLEDYNAWSQDPTSLLLGAAVHFEQAKVGDNQVSGALYNPIPPLGAGGYPYDHLWTWTADGSLKVNGLSLSGALAGQYIEGITVAGASTGTVANYAALGQVAYMVIPDKFEPFARYEYIHIDDRFGATAIPNHNLQAITAGANYYLMKHAAKFTFDVIYLVEPLQKTNTMGVDLTGLGLLPDASGKDSQFAVRAQFQLLF